jgi:hypothetical protein
MTPRDKLGPVLETAKSMAPRRAMRRAPAAVADEPVTAERIEHAMVVLAFIITSTGDTAYAPLLDRLERELAEYKQERDPISRARRILRDHTVEGTGKAIC